MGRGRAPCCDKSKVKRGPWSPAEDLRLITFIQKHGHGNWRALPKQSGLLRCGKSCRLRWINYLRPDVKRGNFSPEEEETIIKLHKTLGNKWSKIASHLSGRTDNEIKNVWNTHLKKRLTMKDADQSPTDEAKEASIKECSSPSPSSTPFISYGDQNIEKEVGNQEGEDCVSKRPPEKQEPTTVISGQCSPTDEPKETSSSSCSMSSYGSNFSNSSRADVTRPQDEMMSLFNFGGPYEVHNALFEATDHQEVSDDLIEIPLESDINFWDMLDNLDSSQSSEVTQQQEFEPSQSSNFGEKHIKEVECSQWLRDLENELGLVGTTCEDQDDPQKNAAEQLVAETQRDEMILMPEIDQGMAYFSMWPPSPHNCDI
ncbi:unnamed protein product [Ilex paraguariensis]|uniref:Uncharacterized protein n=1 Tax=Ilex paraguariensis TaxID=185542 RepID=A0ABC8U1K2_9AQUA